VVICVVEKREVTSYFLHVLQMGRVMGFSDESQEFGVWLSVFVRNMLCRVFLYNNEYKS
jgi:hypothetical protein